MDCLQCGDVRMQYHGIIVNKHREDDWNVASAVKVEGDLRRTRTSIAGSARPGSIAACSTSWSSEILR